MPNLRDSPFKLDGSGIGEVVWCAGPAGAPQHEGEGHDPRPGLQLPDGPREGLFWKGIPTSLVMQYMYVHFTSFWFVYILALSYSSSPFPIFENDTIAPPPPLQDNDNNNLLHTDFF
jgi:hypothetical protein